MPDLVSLKVIPQPGPWEAFLLSVSGFPIDDQESNRAQNLVGRIIGMLGGARNLFSETFIQVEQFDDNQARTLYRPYARHWIPEIGLGVWPDREPPKGWSRDEFSNLGPGEKIRPLMYQVLRITRSSQAKVQAFQLLFRFGPLIRILTSDSTDTFLSKSAAAFLPAITDPSFTCFPYYIPLMEAKTLTSATPEQLRAWFCGASVYIRQSFEDKGILIASSEPLTPILKELGGRFEREPEPAWRIPT